MVAHASGHVVAEGGNGHGANAAIDRDVAVPRALLIEGIETRLEPLAGPLGAHVHPGVEKLKGDLRADGGHVIQAHGIPEPRLVDFCGLLAGHIPHGAGVAEGARNRDGDTPVGFSATVLGIVDVAALDLDDLVDELIELAHWRTPSLMALHIRNSK